jgi:hypothetical protein
VGSLTLTGGIDVGSYTLAIDGSGDVTVSGSSGLTGTGLVSKTGAGKLTLNAASTAGFDIIDGGQVDAAGAINVAAPEPLPHAAFMRALREAWGVRVGLPATGWMASIGAFAMGTDPELVMIGNRADHLANGYAAAPAFAQRGATAARCRGGAGDIDAGCDVRIVATKVCVDEACILSDFF